MWNPPVLLPPILSLYITCANIWLHFSSSCCSVFLKSCLSPRSVSGKKLCSTCGLPLGKGAAMIIETLGLYFHIQCFRVCLLLVLLRKISSHAQCEETVYSGMQMWNGKWEDQRICLFFLCVYVCLFVCVCREVQVMQLMCYYAVRHTNWTKTCHLSSKLSFLTEGSITSLVYSLVFKCNTSYLVIYFSFFQKKYGQSQSYLWSDPWLESFDYGMSDVFWLSPKFSSGILLDCS